MNYYLSTLFFVAVGIAGGCIFFQYYKNLKKKEKLEQTHQLLKTEEISRFGSWNALVVSVLFFILAIASVAMIIRK